MTSVSVIIPVYNGEQILPKNVENVINFDYDEYEIIFVVDQRSSDNSIECVKQICDTYSKCTFYIQNDDLRASGARNIGIDNAKNDFVYFVDADDYVSPNALKEFVRIQAKYDTDLVCCSYTRDASKLPNWDSTKTYSDCIIPAEKALVDVISGRIAGMPWTWFARKKFLNDNNLRYAPTNVAEDTDFVIRSILHTEKIAYYDCPLYNYRPCVSPSDYRRVPLARARIYMNLMDLVNSQYPEINFEFSKCAIIYILNENIHRKLCEFIECYNDSDFNERIEKYLQDDKKLRFKLLKISPVLYYYAARVGSFLKRIISKNHT